MKSQLGFLINPTNGVWARLDEDEDRENDPPGRAVPQRIVPIVQDHKNAALLRLAGEPLSQGSMATLQHALTRGVELCFQVEEGEILMEPTPSREERRTLLAYEASEGGAGVLGRLATEPGLLAQVASEALRLMHYEDPSAAAAAADPAMLRDVPGAECVQGCYRCLLSYRNQPDHELIDRTDDPALRVLLRLARAAVTVRSAQHGDGPLRCDAPGASPWREALSNWGLPRPDDEPVVLAGVALPLAWRSHLVAAGPDADVTPARDAAEAQGYTLIGLPSEPGASPPPGLPEALGAQP